MNKVLLSCMMCIGLLTGMAKSEIIDTLYDDDIKAGETLTLSRDTTYILKGKVFVESTAVLNIPAGTIIKGALGSGENASALVICRGAKIYARGTKYNPIIFTAASDNFNNLTSSDKGLWGGLVILGNAVTNEGEDNIEGIALTNDDTRTKFGGNNDDDTSGVIQYVSIRHSGVSIATDNELNGLSLAGVGRGTIIDHVECYASADDGFEWWGGTVNCTYLVASFCDDDCFDFDQGYRGKGQFWFSIQDSIEANMNANYAGEWDGDDTKGAKPYALPTLANVTFIGGGSKANSKNAGIIIRANGAASVYNSVFSNFKGSRALTIEHKTDTSAQDSWDRLTSNDIKFYNNLFYNFGGKSNIDSIMYIDTASSAYALSKELADSMKQWKNDCADPKFSSISYASNLNPLPSAESPVYSNLASLPNDKFFKTVSFKGAFDKENWAAYWTGLWDEGVLADVGTTTPEKQLRDADIKENGKLTLYKDTTYILVEKVFVENGAVLTIQAGTVIKANDAKGENAAALIICRGGKIIAKGTVKDPIIFTSIHDDINNPNDLTNLDKGLWGGVVILGKAKTNEGEDDIEGIATADARTQFGGTDDNDSSGVFQYVSIRHAGIAIAPDNELNGLSLAAVGSKTVMDHVEIFASADDGIEWWGGTINTSYMVSAFSDDDAFDIDQGFRGKGQFWFSIQDSVSTTSTNYGGEWDGDDTKGAEPFAMPLIANATFIGGGSKATTKNSGIIIRANGAAKVYNSIFCYFKDIRALTIEDKQDAGAQDSWKRFLDGDTKFYNNIFYKFGNQSSLDSIMYADTASSKWVLSTTLIDSMKAWKNSGTNPKLTSIGYALGKNGLNPSPASGSPALSNIFDLSKADPFFTKVSFRGAFGNNNWADEWSFLSQGGYFSDNFVKVRESKISSKQLARASMSIISGATTLSVKYALPQSGKMSLNLYNLNGKLIAKLANGAKLAGSYLISADISSLASGTYICRFAADGISPISNLVTIKQ